MTGMVILATFLGLLLIVSAVLFWRYRNKQSDPNSCVCRKCGTELAEEDETCPGCGNPAAGNTEFRRGVVEKLSFRDRVGRTLTRAWDSNVLAVFGIALGTWRAVFLGLQLKQGVATAAALASAFTLAFLFLVKNRVLRNAIIWFFPWLLKT